MTSPAEPTLVPTPAANALFNQSLEKGLAVLRAFDAAHRTLTLAALAALTGISKGSAQKAPAGGTAPALPGGAKACATVP